MGIKELCEKYGKKNSRQAVNAAIRAELVGGDAVIDALTSASELDMGMRGLDLPPSERRLIGSILSLLKTAREAMAAEIATRYGLGPTV